MANQHRTRFNAIAKSSKAIAQNPSKIPDNLPKMKGYANLSILLLKGVDGAMETVMFSDERLKSVKFGEDFDGVRLHLDAKDNDGDWHRYDTLMFADGANEFLDGVTFDG